MKIITKNRYWLSIITFCILGSKNYISNKKGIEWEGKSDKLARIKNNVYEENKQIDKRIF